jgi:8-oxo-dGTP pyrophosphatase MutT (NUDIX family)
MNDIDLLSLLVRQLSEYRCVDDPEGRNNARFKELLGAAPRCAFRDHFVPGHLTGSAWVIDRSGTRVLLLHHGKLNRWLQPGGHADGDFDLARVALRETQEESGLTRLRLVEGGVFDLDIHDIPARGTEPAHLHFDVRYLIEGDIDEPLLLSDESHALEWVELGRLREYTTERSVLRMAQKCELLLQKSPQLLNL